MSSDAFEMSAAKQPRQHEKSAIIQSALYFHK